jgi:putative endopeptidase
MTNINDDFYTYVNYDWLNSNPIPNEYTKWSNFHVLHQLTQHRLKEILQVIPVTDEQLKLNILWNQGLDEEYLNIKGHNHLTKLFDKFKLESDIDTILVELFKYNLCFLFDISAYTDLKDSSRNVLYWDVMRLSLPDRDYYLNDKMKDKQEQYKTFLSNFKNHFNLDFNVDKLYDFEEQVAKVKLSKSERRDPTKLYNEYTFEKLEQEFEGINWKYIFSEFNIPTNDKIIVTEPMFFTFMSKYIKSAKNNDNIMIELKNFIKYKIINFVCTYLDDSSYMLHFGFYDKQLYGQKEPKKRWTRVLYNVENVLGELLSKIYVDKYFNQEQKSSCTNMINEILVTFRQRLINISWMSNKTKLKALEKLNKFNVKIGFPDKWKDFSKLKINSNNEYYENFLEASRWKISYNLEKLYKPVDKLEWYMNAHNINAYYSQTRNEIVFPAGILQEPFYSSQQSLAENLGGIGAIIGHEITHGFDDEGRLYDSEGNLNDWWTADDTKQFNEKSKLLEELFSGFSYYDINVNGKLTLGENIADLGGLIFSLKTIERLANPDDKENQIKKLFEQWAKIWRCNITPDTLKNQLLTDPHSPSQLRVNAILSNIDEFYKIYQVKPEDKMYIAPECRCVIW